jgi:hypothetical protein
MPIFAVSIVWCANAICLLQAFISITTAKQHGGADAMNNLAWTCQECNLLKATNSSGIDPATGDVVPLFHPRKHLWADHFEDKSAQILGLTAIGRATVRLLQMNSAERLEIRSGL